MYICNIYIYHICIYDIYTYRFVIRSLSCLVRSFLVLPCYEGGFSGIRRRRQRAKEKPRGILLIAWRADADETNLAGLVQLAENKTHDIDVNDIGLDMARWQFCEHMNKYIDGDFTKSETSKWFGVTKDTHLQKEDFTYMQPVSSLSQEGEEKIKKTFSSDVPAALAKSRTSLT